MLNFDPENAAIWNAHRRSQFHGVLFMLTSLAPPGMILAQNHAWRLAREVQCKPALRMLQYDPDLNDVWHMIVRLCFPRIADFAESPIQNACPTMFWTKRVTNASFWSGKVAHKSTPRWQFAESFYSQSFVWRRKKHHWNISEQTWVYMTVIANIGFDVNAYTRYKYCWQTPEFWKLNLRNSGEQKYKAFPA